MHFQFRKPLIATISLGLLLALGGCATPATHQAMTPATIKVANHHAKSVTVAVGGGSETSAAGKSQIGDAELRQAVINAIEQSKTFSSVVEGKKGDYLLNVSIVDMNQPSFGFSFTVGLEMAWSLTEVSSGKVVWREAIKSEHTAGATEAFAGTTRLRLATEGAAKNNVAAGVAKLSEQKL